MEEMQQITLDQWLSWKDDIREKLREASENFVHIGYRLKQIRDSEMFNGEADIFGFAMKEYGLSKSTTSRFIAINERFSEGGNSLELRREYKALGSSKLAEMLALPDAECQMITERTTVKEIRELKEFSRQQASEPEGEEGGQEGEEKKLTPLQRCLVDYFRDKKEMLNGVMRAYREDALKLAAELMNPSGYATHKKGICFLFMYEYEKGVMAKILTEPEPRRMSWEAFLWELDLIFGDYYRKSGCDDIYGEYYEAVEKTDEDVPAPEPESEEAEKPEGAESQDAAVLVATSQQEDTEEKELASGEVDQAPVEDVEEPVQDPEEIKIPEKPEGAGNQNAAASVATSQREDQEEDGADEELGAIWCQIVDLEGDIFNFVGYYTEYAAANGDIPLEKLRQAYKNTIDMAAGMERLLMSIERGIKADE